MLKNPTPPGYASEYPKYSKGCTSPSSGTSKGRKGRPQGDFYGRLKLVYIILTSPPAVDLWGAHVNTEQKLIK
jgi:hypothetical protein